MQIDVFRLWSTRIVTFTLAGLAAASIGFWATRGWTAASNDASPVAVSVALASDSQGLARALGGSKGLAQPAAEAAAASRYALLGVVASQDRSAALISVDGQRAKPVRVGHAVDDRLMLQSVTARSAVLATSSDGPVSMTLELPMPAQ